MAKRAAIPNEDQHQKRLLDAEKESNKILKALPEKWKIRRENYRRIHDISTKLLSDEENFIQSEVKNLEKNAKIG